MAQNTIKLHRRLTSKFVFMTLCFLVPQVFLFFFSSNKASEMLIASLRDNLKEKAYLVGADIDRFFDQRKHDVLTLSQADVLETDDNEAASQYLTEIIQATPYLDDVRILDRNGSMIAGSSDQKHLGKNMMQLHPSLWHLIEGVLAAEQGDLFVSDILKLNDGGPQLLFLTPITDDSNTIVIKILLVEINLDTVKKIVADFDERVIGDKYVYLVDNDGRVIVSADPEIYTLSPYPDLAVRPDLLKNFSQQGDVGSVIYEDNKGEEVMAGFADMAELGVNKAMDWSIIAVAPIADITSPVDSFRTNLLLFTALVFGVVMLVMFLTSHNILKSVQRVVDGARRVGEGDIDFRIDPGSDDELGYLARTINHTLDNLVAAQKGALQAQRMEAVGQLTGGIAHDFNNLLAIIMVNAQMLEDRTDEDEEAERFIEEIIAAVDRGASLTGRLVAYSRKTTLIPVAADISDLIGNLHDMLQRTLEATIELKVEEPQDLWPATIDPHQFENAMVNLAINARDAMPRGGTLTIETANVTLDKTYAEQHEEVTPGEYIMVSVSDTGTGMTPEVLKKVFEPFFTTKEVGKGSGLGLSMVYGFVKQSNGHIDIFSVVDHGTTVRLFLPRSQERAARTDTKDEALHDTQGSERILVVEDDPDLRKIAVAIFRKGGYEVAEAENGEGAIDHLKTAAFKLLFTDIVLPGDMNGLEIAENAQRLQPNIKVLYTTGYSQDAVINGGYVDLTVITKPYRLEELQEKVRAMLNDEDD